MRHMRICVPYTMPFQPKLQSSSKSIVLPSPTSIFSSSRVSSSSSSSTDPEPTDILPLRRILRSPPSSSMRGTAGGARNSRSKPRSGVVPAELAARKSLGSDSTGRGPNAGLPYSSAFTRNPTPHTFQCDRRGGSPWAR